MSLISLDLKNEVLLNLRQKLQDAMNANDAKQFAEAFEGILQCYARENLDTFEELRGESDARVLAGRGLRQLTSKERTYYQKLSEAMRSGDPRQAVNNLDVVMPETVFD